MKWLTVAVVLGALLDVGVFVTQQLQWSRINHNSTVGQCWDSVLDHAVATPHPTPALHAELFREAVKCAQLDPKVPTTVPPTPQHVEGGVR